MVKSDPRAELAYNYLLHIGIIGYEKLNLKSKTLKDMYETEVFFVATVRLSWVKSVVMFSSSTKKVLLSQKYCKMTLFRD